MKRKLRNSVITAFLIGLTFGQCPKTINAEDQPAVEMHRLYNKNSGEHFYTANRDERDALVIYGWKYEGVGWYAPHESNTPVYRLYNKYGGEHHYTMSKAERDGLIKAGWKYEGIGWYSDDAKTVILYREYNPNAYSCNHNYTTSEKEHNALVKLGWKNEGNAWYGVLPEGEGTEHVHDWQPIIAIIHHEPVFEDKWTEDKPAWDEKILVKEAYDEEVTEYRYEVHAICSGCGQDFGTTAPPEEHVLAHFEKGEPNGYFTRQVKVPYTVIVHHEAQYDIINHEAEGHYEKMKVKNAWDETVIVGFECSICGKEAD